MTTPKEKAELTAKILILFNSGKIEKIEKIVRRHWIVFPELAEPIRDNEQIAFAAVSSAMQIGHGMSERLREDIPFFVRAFDVHNVYRDIGPVSLTSPRDLLFILLFARYCCNYYHLIGETEVAELFRLSDIKEEAEAAEEFKELIFSRKNWSEMGSLTKSKCIEYFKSKAPGFADSSYKYAYEWLSRNKTFDAVFG